jgi:hypothetical protein
MRSLTEHNLIPTQHTKTFTTDRDINGLCRHQDRALASLAVQLHHMPSPVLHSQQPQTRRRVSIFVLFAAFSIMAGSLLLLPLIPHLHLINQLQSHLLRLLPPLLMMPEPAIRVALSQTLIPHIVLQTLPRDH